MLSDDEIALLCTPIQHQQRPSRETAMSNELTPLLQSFTILSRFKSGTEEVVPLDVVLEYGLARERAAYERAAQECESRATAPQGEDYLACYYACATAIRALGRQHD